MRINFILPFPPRVPGGGTKIMYEYANLMAKRGHSVCFYHAIKTTHFTYRIPYIIRLLYFLFIERKLPKWFLLHEKIKSRNIPFVSDLFIRDADIVISSWWATAFEVDGLSAGKGRKFNLVQDYEIWTGHIEEVHKSYRLPAQKIIYVSYLQQIFSEHNSQQATYIPVGIDREKFFLKEKIEIRSPFTVAMLYSQEPRKDTNTGINALKKVKTKFPQLQVKLFGVTPEPGGLPEGFSYFERPSDLCQLYNSCAIYVTPSLQEGWALPPAEAMTCGCALVCSDIAGHRDYAVEGITALKFKPGDSDAMADALIRVIADHQLRIEIAKNGNSFCERYDWQKSADLMESAFLEK